MTLPPDNHVHSEWSWDAPIALMAGSCARAVELGLPAIAFTEHLDHTVWTLPAAYASDPHLASFASPDGVLTPPAFDAAGYLAEIERCRDLFPQLRILSGLEVGEPHWHAAAVSQVLAAGPFDRVLGSLHDLPSGDGFTEPAGLYEYRDPADVMRDYLAEIATLITECDVFSVLAHIDYPVRAWPGAFDPYVFEDGFRHALRLLAGTDRALEINTRLPMDAVILRWWREEGGRAVSFGSDAHLPGAVAHGFAEAAAMAEAHGFRPGRHPYDLWSR